MAGLAGLYDPRADAGAVDAVLARMARVVAQPSVPTAPRRAAGSRAGCVRYAGACGADADQPAVEERAGLWLMLDGELYNNEELRRFLRRRGAAAVAPGDAALCLALYRAEGESFVARLNGQFNLVIYRGSDQSLLIATDRYGYRPLFVSASGPRLLFASEMKAILAVLDATPALDGIGLLQFLRDGSAVGERTWLEPIRVLGPGTVLTATPQGTARRRYFTLRYREGRAPMRLAAFVEGFGVKLHRATERVMQRAERVGIALSGGLDSRCVALAIHDSYLPVPAYTFGYPESRDVQYARMLAALRGLEHFHLALEPGYLGQVVVPVVWRTEGLLPFTATTSLFFHPRIAAAMDVILTGHCGDALTGSHIRPFMLLAGSKAQLIERMFRGRRRVADDDLRRICNPAFYRRYAGGLADAFAATFVDIDGAALANVADAWDMENRQHRGTFHSPSVDRYRFEVRTPFLDNELVDHLVQAPPRWRFQQRAYKRMILDTFPHAAHVPWAYTGACLTASPLRELARITWNYGSKRARAAWAHLAHRGYIGEDFRDLAAELRADRRVAQMILGFTRASTFPADVFDRRGIEEVVARHWERGEDLTDLVAGLATVAAACGLFLGGGLSSVPPEADPLATAALASEPQGNAAHTAGCESFPHA
jgi:asparagine synthase (glutamine-hydrolysing)